MKVSFYERVSPLQYLSRNEFNEIQLLTLRTKEFKITRLCKTKAFIFKSIVPSFATPVPSRRSYFRSKGYDRIWTGGRTLAYSKATTESAYVATHLIPFNANAKPFNSFPKEIQWGQS